ncbi:hypothetical protein CY658_10260 [Variovorax sp. RO1]|nr:hypothetical protein CY658_10260 [Variovorax sp. RO1]
MSLRQPPSGGDACGPAKPVPRRLASGMDQCWLRGQTSDALHAVLCAAGFSIRWLRRAMVRLGLKDLYSRPIGPLPVLPTALEPTAPRPQMRAARVTSAAG